MQAVRELCFFCLDEWVIKCPAVELFEAMDCIFEVCYDLKCEKYLYEVTFGDININCLGQSIVDDLT